MARARLPSGERWLVALISVITFAVALQLWNLLYEGSDAGLARTHANLHKHKGRYVVPASFNVSLEERSNDDDAYMGDESELVSLSSGSTLQQGPAGSGQPKPGGGGQQGPAGSGGHDRNSQHDDGEEGKDPVLQMHSWTRSLRKGQQIVGFFSMPSIPKQSESRFTDYKDVEKYGWQVIQNEIDPAVEDPSLSEPLDLMKISYGDKKTVDKWHYLEVTHARTSRGPNGQLYPATEGRFFMTHNPQDHLIIGENYLSPSKTFDGQTLPPDQVVPLKFASDLIFLNWVFECRQAGASPASLKYYLMPSVINLETRNVVRKIVGGPLVKKLPAWPGTVFTNKDHPSEFAGLLGTPVGASIGIMLAQRKSTFGRDRSIVGIRVWSETGVDYEYFEKHGPALSMLLELSDLRSSERLQGARQSSTALAGPSRTHVPRDQLELRDPTKHQPLIPSILSQVSSGVLAATSLATKVKSGAPTAASVIPDFLGEVQVKASTALSAIPGCFSDAPLEVEAPVAVSGISGPSRARRSRLEPRRADPWHEMLKPPILSSLSSAAPAASSLATKVKGAAPTAVSAISSLVGEVENEAPTAISAISGCLSNAPLESEALTAVSGTPDPSYTRRSRLDPRDPNFLDDLISIGTHVVGEFLGDEPTSTPTSTDLSAILSLLSNPLVQAAEPTAVSAISSVFGGIRNGRHGAPTAVSAIPGSFSNTALQIQAPTAVVGIPGCFGNKTGVSGALKGQGSAVAASVASGLLSSATGSSKAELKVRQTTQTDCRTPHKSRARPRAVNDYWGSPVSRPQSVPDGDRFGDRVYMAGQWMFSWMAVFGR